MRLIGKGALAALKRCKSSLSRMQSLLYDSGYAVQSLTQDVKGILGKHVTV